MKISARAEYACLACLELAMNYGSGEPVPVKRVAASHAIPQGFLVQILLQLKAAGYVTSTRGASGGYQLARDPHAISLLDILSAIDGSGRLDYDHTTSALTPSAHSLRTVWRHVDAAAERVLEQTSLADLVEQTAIQSRQPVVGDWI